MTASAAEQLLPADTEARLASFPELVATAIAKSRADLAASRARVVAAAGETRRRIERDLLIEVPLEGQSSAMSREP
jgi:hypothetical protein